MYLAIVICLVIMLLSIFHFNKKVSTIYIRLLVILLVVIIIYSVYISGDLCINIYIYKYIYINNKGIILQY